MQQDGRFTSDQRKITVFCMVAYSILYFMRLNVSLALEDMMIAFQASPESMGAITSAFFWCYAFGQLVFGFLGDRLPVRFMVFTGLLGSGILNLAIGLSPAFCFAFESPVFPIVIFWALNGVFQSMLWSPIVKCVAANFEGNKKVIVSFALSITQVIGYILAWVGSYFLREYINWQFVFLVPAILGILFSLIWVFRFRFSSVVTEVRSKKGPSLIRQPALLSFLGVIALFSILFGLVKSSIDTWLPTMIGDVGGLAEGGIVITLLLIPMVNFAGIMLSKTMVKKLRGDIYKTILLIWGGAVIISAIALFMFNFNPIVFVVFVAVLFGFVYSQTPLFTSFIPLDFVKWDCVSTVTGFVDFAIYLGAGVTGIISGKILGDESNMNWSGLSTYWLVILAVGMVFAITVYFWHHALRKKISREEAEWD